MDSYNVLGVDRNASIETIKQSYHKLVLKYHPDRNQKQTEEMKCTDELFLQIQEAWETLRDENKRILHDKQLKQHANKKNDVSISYQVTLADLELIDNEKDEHG